MNKVEELIHQGINFSFANNSYRSSHGTYGRPSDELLAWTASIEHYIVENYDDNSGPYSLFRTGNISKITGNYSDEFDKQLAILRGSLKACLQNPPNKKRNSGSQIINLVNNPYSWCIAGVLIASSFSLGIYFGTSKFDNDKNNLYEENKKLKEEVLAFKKQTAKKDSSVASFKH